MVQLTNKTSSDYNDNGNQFVYLISGKEKTCYNKATNSAKWTIKTDAPSPKFFPHKEYMAYISIYSGWKD
ncbi:MAG: hypothetical protein Q8942_16765 [Bacillota bacterium]|nr:hypothetical protein [Bacillota bacterium]